MNPIFIESMNEMFNGKFTIESADDTTFKKFPAKSPDFGDVEIYEDAPGEYIVVVGKFTHGHFDAGTDDEQADDEAKLRTRAITPADYPLLEDFLYNAIFIPPGEEPPLRDIIYDPDVFIYIDGFGEKHGDCGVVADKDGKTVGAAWTRIIPAFGHIDDDTPELATSVLTEFRGQGIGTMLMNHLFELLKRQGFKWTSLAVQKKNAAVRFYQRLGYVTVDENNEEFIMLKDLKK